MRRFIGRMLVFHTSALPKRIGIPIRRMGRKLLFARGKCHAKAIERSFTKSYSRTDDPEVGIISYDAADL